ncbi:MAG: serine/threonine protein kinase [Planctomycetia bacterium]|nr:serine/threonine protein kinase [Planctomycetia bacterium]
MAPADPAACPPIETLAAAAEGRLDPAAEAAMVAHLDRCTCCRDRLDAIAAAADFAARVGPTLSQPKPASAALDTAIDLLKAAGPTPAGAEQPADRSACPYADLLPWLEPAPQGIGRVGDYLLTRFLGRGGMGVVFAGREQALDRPVAIKFLTPALAAEATHRDRFLAEARAAAAVNHPNVVTILAVTETEGLPLLVMERIEGEPLSELLGRQHRFDLPTMLSIGRKLAAGLQAAHARGLLHRDIKPANLLVSADAAVVKLTDFGLAQLQVEPTPAPAGTPGFVPPEVIAGDKPDARCDLYSMGCLFRELLAGQQPPAWLEALVERLLAPSPAARPQSAAEVEELLMAGMADLSPVTQPRQASGSSASRPGWLAALAGGLALAALLVGLMAGLGRQDESAVIEVSGKAADDLAAVLAEAESGTTIVLEEAGTIELTSLELGDRELTLRAAGDRPLLRLRAGNTAGRQSLFRVSGSLNLEGLDLELIAPDDSGSAELADQARCLIDVDGGSLRLEDCTLEVEGDACCIIAAESDRLELIDSQLHAPDGAAVDWQPTSGGLAVAEQTIISGSTAWAVADPVAATLRLTRVTGVADRLISIRWDELEAPADSSLLVEARSSVLAAQQAVLLLHSEAISRQAFTEMLRWQGEGNLLDGPLIELDRDSGRVRPDWFAADDDWTRLDNLSSQRSELWPIRFVTDRETLRRWPLGSDGLPVEAFAIRPDEQLLERFEDEPPGAVGDWCFRR